MFQFSGRITQAPRFLHGFATQVNNVLDLHTQGLVIDSNDIIPEQQPDGRIRLMLNPKEGWRQGSGAGPVTSITGACCIGTDCSITTETDCAGTWQGAGSGCSPNPCSGGGGGAGACCVDSDCSIQTADDCSGMGGTYQGDDTECDPNPCTVAATGACCVDSDCSIQTADDCSGMGGTYHGDDTTCDSNPCDSGGCCVDADCSIQTADDCSGMGGTYLGAGEDCPEVNPCSSCGNCSYLGFEGIGRYLSSYQYARYHGILGGISYDWLEEAVVTIDPMSCEVSQTILNCYYHTDFGDCDPCTDGGCVRPSYLDCDTTTYHYEDNTHRITTGTKDVGDSHVDCESTEILSNRYC